MIVAAGNAVRITTGYPQGCICKHSSVACIKEIILFANLGEALCADIIGKVISLAADGGKAILQNISVSADPVMSSLQACCMIQTISNIATSVYRYSAIGSTKNDTVFNFLCTVEYRTVFTVIGCAFSLNESVTDTRTNAGILIEMPPGTIFTACQYNREIAVGNVTILICTVGALFQFDPSGYQIPSSPVISCAGRGFYKCAPNQFTRIIEGILHATDGADAGVHCKSGGVKVIIILANRLPAGFQYTYGCIVALTVDLQQTGILGFTGIDTVLTKVIVVAFYLLNASQLYALIVVSKAAVLVVPALLELVDQGVAVVELLIGILEVATLVVRVVRIDIRIQAKDFLILRFTGEAVQSACTHIDLVADIAGIDHFQLVFSIPPGIRLGCQLQTIYDTHGIGRINRNCLCLLFPIQGQGQRAVLLIQSNLGKCEVLIDQLQFADI